MAAASHIFLGADIESRVEVDNEVGIVRTFLKDYDVALIELPPGCAVQDTELGSAVVMEDALLTNERHSIPCRDLASLSPVSLFFNASAGGQRLAHPAGGETNRAALSVILCRCSEQRSTL